LVQAYRSFPRKLLFLGLEIRLMMKSMNEGLA